MSALVITLACPPNDMAVQRRTRGGAERPTRPAVCTRVSQVPATQALGAPSPRTRYDGWVGGEARHDQVLSLFDEGRAAAARGDYALAVAKLQASVALAPAAASLVALGQSLSRLGRHAEAVVSLAAAIGLGDTTVLVRLRLAGAIADVGDRSEALRRLRDLQREHPDDPEVRFELRRILLDPLALARTANRWRLLDEIRVALPEIRIDTHATWMEGLAKVGRYISARAAPLGDPRRLESAFRLLDRLAESPDPEVADLLTAVVFPEFTGWSLPVDAARAALGARARRALDYAIALWGEPSLVARRSLVTACANHCGSGFRASIPPSRRRSQSGLRWDSTS